MANQIQGLRPDGTLPTVAVEHVQQIVSATAGMGVPIFPTLVEAAQWEAANPGRVALTLEPSTPDVTPPTPGTLAVNPRDITAEMIVEGASDDRAIAGYAFSVDSGATWSPWQPDASYTAEGLDPLTPYGGRHRVRDGAGNLAQGAVVGFVTEEVQADPLSPSDVGDVYAMFDFNDAVISAGRIQSVADATGTRQPAELRNDGPAAITVAGRTWAQFVSGHDGYVVSPGAVGDGSTDRGEGFTVGLIARLDAPSPSADLLAAGPSIVGIAGGGGGATLYVGNGSHATDPLPIGVPVLITAAQRGSSLTIRVSSLTYSSAGFTGNLAAGRNFMIPTNSGRMPTASIAAAWHHEKEITQADHDGLLSWARDTYGVA